MTHNSEVFRLFETEKQRAERESRDKAFTDRFSRFERPYKKQYEFSSSALENSPAGLADAHSKSPSDPGTEQREAGSLLRTIETLPDDFTDDGNCCAGKLKDRTP